MNTQNNNQDRIRLVKESLLTQMGMHLQNDIENLKIQQNKIQNLLMLLFSSPIAAQNSNNEKNGKQKNEDEKLNEEFKNVLAKKE